MECKWLDVLLICDGAECGVICSDGSDAGTFTPTQSNNVSLILCDDLQLSHLGVRHPDGGGLLLLQQVGHLGVPVVPV